MVISFKYRNHSANLFNLRIFVFVLKQYYEKIQYICTGFSSGKTR